MLDRFGQTTLSSKLDLRTSFHQIWITSEEIEKTESETKDCHFEVLDMTMDLKNAPEIFKHWWIVSCKTA